MIHLPASLYDAIGAIVAAYGVFHLVYAQRFPKRGERLSHRLRGVLFLLLGAWLVATGLGWRPFAHESPLEKPDPAAQRT